MPKPRFSTYAFEFAHAKKPRGRGSWAFFFDGRTDIDDAFWAHDCTFGEAKAKAMAHATARGVHDVEVGS
jgi:hypothetical protein